MKKLKGRNGGICLKQMESKATTRSPVLICVPLQKFSVCHTFVFYCITFLSLFYVINFSTFQSPPLEVTLEARDRSGSPCLVRKPGVPPALVPLSPFLLGLQPPVPQTHCVPSHPRVLSTPFLLPRLHFPSIQSPIPPPSLANSHLSFRLKLNVILLQIILPLSSKRGWLNHCQVLCVPCCHFLGPSANQVCPSHPLPLPLQCIPGPTRAGPRLQVPSLHPRSGTSQGLRIYLSNE